MTKQLIDGLGGTDLVTMLLPVKGRNLIIPNVTVAEIVSLSNLQRRDEAPGWIRGFIAWRGFDIPVISFEGVNEDPFAAESPELRAAVINGTSDIERLPYYGFATYATPRMMRLTPDEITSCEAPGMGPAELMAVNASGEEATIPNLAYIEEQLLKVVTVLECAVAP